ncbi:hypothetical protein CkP1_0012 [Citrobacter phage CkP1]|nr:hypothetical protein CkP1_0012 [Citrobacter phage CkP1]
MFKKGTPVEVIKGKHKGRKGDVIGSTGHNGSIVRVIDKHGLSYRIYVKDQFLKIANETLGEFLAKTKPIEFKSKDMREGDIVRVVLPELALESSTAEASYSYQNLCYGKQALVTLVYEEDGVQLANIVYQGQYSLIPTSALEFLRDSKYRLGILV